MDQAFFNFLTKIEPGYTAKSIQAVLELKTEGATVPFMARYRKEKTGNLDEVQIRQIIDSFETFNEIIKRKTFLLKEIGEQGNLTEELKKRIEFSWDLGDLEEIYRPYKKKKKTKATIARDAGLEPLAQWIWDVGHGASAGDQTLEIKAKTFINPSHKIITYEEAIKGAQDILIEKIANEPTLRAAVHQDHLNHGKVIAKAAKGFKPHSKFEMYKEFEDSVKDLLLQKNSHRYLAMRRGWQEEELTVTIKANEEDAIKKYSAFATSTPDNAIGELLKTCAKQALQVYVLPSIVNEIHRLLKEKSDDHAIMVFAENVKKLLLASPFGPKVILGVDPGLRTGCKIALIDKAGTYLSHTVLHTLGSDAESKALLLFGEVLKHMQIDAIGVGNGTAGRETEVFLRKILKSLEKNIPIIMVNESGASVYSASEVARQEFPDLDLTVRGAISIARRLQDPLSELVKIDPKSIGVGQYQHDVSPSLLKKSLDAVVESCVNNVGVDLNTASSSLLSYVSGIGPTLAQNIIEHRKTKGLFQERSELLKVGKFSTKVFEQSAGFLRIRSGKHILDSTGIHPERYSAVRDMAQDLGVGLTELIGEGAKKLLANRTKWATLIGEFTFDDIVKELEKPGRDPRDPFKTFQFREDIFEVKDLKEGMICPGLVTNVTNFGAFVDIGVHQDGLVHISELSQTFVDDPKKIVSPGDAVKVKVLKVDSEKNQISLSMRMEERPQFRTPSEDHQRPQHTQKQQPKTTTQRPSNTGRPNSSGPSSDRRGFTPSPQQKGRHQGQGQGPHSGQSRPAATPFNNPFAGLGSLLKK